MLLLYVLPANPRFPSPQTDSASPTKGATASSSSSSSSSSSAAAGAASSPARASAGARAAAESHTQGGDLTKAQLRSVLGAMAEKLEELKVQIERKKEALLRAGRDEGEVEAIVQGDIQERLQVLEKEVGGDGDGGAEMERKERAGLQPTTAMGGVCVLALTTKRPPRVSALPRTSPDSTQQIQASHGVDQFALMEAQSKYGDDPEIASLMAKLRTQFFGEDQMAELEELQKEAPPDMTGEAFLAIMQKHMGILEGHFKKALRDTKEEAGSATFDEKVQYLEYL